MAGVLTSQGIGSGLDVKSLVQKLVTAEGAAPTNRLNSEEAKYQAQLSALGSLKSALSDFETSVAALKDPTTFTATKATSSDSSLFSAVGDSTAVPGSYNVEVLAVAKPQKLLSAGVASADSVVGTGTLQISDGSNSFSVSIDSTNNSLAGIANAINGSADNTSVNATVVNVDNGSGGTVSKLILTSKTPGTANTISVNVTDSDGNNTDTSGLSQLATGNLSEIQTAQDASIKIDQQTLTRSTNSISDAIPGVTIDLHKSNPGTVETLNVATNTSAIKTKIQDFVSKYNQLEKSIKSSSSYNSDTKQAGALLGDATTLTVSMGIRRVVGGSVSSAEGAYHTLAEIGITTQKDGTLSIDGAKLDKALSLHMKDVSDLLSGKNGLAGQLDSQLNSFVGPEGSIATRMDGINQSIKDIGNQRDALNRRLTALQKRYTKEFNAMDSIVGQLQQTGSYLSQQLSNLPGASSGSSKG